MIRIRVASFCELLGAERPEYARGRSESCHVALGSRKVDIYENIT